jgi:hypothetical protein
MKIGVYYIRQPVEGEERSFSRGQGSVWQWKTEIPRDSGKRVRQTGCTLFLCPTVVPRSRFQCSGFSIYLKFFVPDPPAAENLTPDTKILRFGVWNLLFSNNSLLYF